MHRHPARIRALFPAVCAGAALAGDRAGHCHLIHHPAPHHPLRCRRADAGSADFAALRTAAGAVRSEPAQNGAGSVRCLACRGQLLPDHAIVRRRPPPPAGRDSAAVTGKPALPGSFHLADRSRCGRGFPRRIPGAVRAGLPFADRRTLQPGGTPQRRREPSIPFYAGRLRRTADAAPERTRHAVRSRLCRSAGQPGGGQSLF